MSPAQQVEMAEEIAADLARIVAELLELADDAAAARLLRAHLRIDRSISNLTSTLHGLNAQAGKLRGRLAGLKG